MRIGVLGDIHSNIEALRAVTERMIAVERIDQWVQVGDIVGYGADPAACIKLVRELNCHVCIGNHDAAVIGRLETGYFNAYARRAIEWTRSKLQRHDTEFLASLPLVAEATSYTVVHGSLHAPEQFGYVISKPEAIQALRVQSTRVAFIGHSHVPAVYWQKAGDPTDDVAFSFEPELELRVSGHARTLVNVGSVGQPRDEDSRAAYCVLDTDQSLVTIKRVEYDIATAQAKIRRAGLPSVLADRLALGV